IDTERDLLTRAVAEYRQYLQLTRDRYAGGVASELDVDQAQSQLSGTEAQLTDLEVQRAALEHAMAVLTGRTPVDVNIAAKNIAAEPPPVPVGVPSALLERRPDIAASERRVAFANEQIGIATAAFFPSL